MPFDAHVLEVLIASPSDTKEARDEVEKSLHSWNTSRAKREGIILLPRRWETAAIPRMGEGDGQEVINAELVERTDIIVVIFNSKLGQATARALSGTVEELEKGIRDGKQVHVYFSEAPVDRDSLKSAGQVEKFRKTLEDKGLYGSYSDAADLGFKVRTAIEGDLDKLGLAPPTGRKTVAGADPVASYDQQSESYTDTKGKLKHRRRHRIRIVNNGGAAAENLSFTLTALDGESLPNIWDNEVTPTVPPTGEYSWIITPYGSSSNSVEVAMTWTEAGKEKSKSHSLSLV